MIYPIDYEESIEWDWRTNYTSLVLHCVASNGQGDFVGYENGFQGKVSEFHDIRIASARKDARLYIFKKLGQYEEAA